MSKAQPSTPKGERAKLSYMDKISIRLYRFFNLQKITEREADFNKRAKEDPERETHVQRMRLIILNNRDDSTQAALDIVDYFLPKS